MFIEAKKIYGKKICTNNQQLDTIMNLWEEVPAMNLTGDIYAVYSNYASDYTDDFDLLVGNEQADFEVSSEILAGNYLAFPAQTASPENVGKIWQKIWKEPAISQQRSYKTDFEHYATDGTVTVYLSVK